MNDNDRRRYEMLVRVNQFGIDNAADFTGIATAKFTEVGTKVNEIETESADQAAGLGSAAQEHEVKDTARENLREQMSDISRTARSMEYDFDGISDLFRFARNSNDATLLAKGRAFHTESAAYEADFVAYGMPAGFRLALKNACDAFEASFSATASATAEHVAATADISAKVREGMIAVHILSGIVKNVYENDPGQLAAWISASHVEKPPSPPPPTP